MADLWSEPAGRRKRRWRDVALVALVVLGHLLVLAWLDFFTRRSPGPGEGDGVVVGLFDGDALGLQPRLAARDEAPAQAAPTQPDPPPPDPAEPEPPTVEPEPPLTVEPLILAGATQPDFTSEPVDIGSPTEAAAPMSAAAAGGNGDLCRLSDAVQGTLQGDAAVRAAIARVPREGRSVANAIQLWNGDWGADGAGLAATLDPVRQAIVERVRAAPAACRGAVVSGPVFIAVEGGVATTMLTIGSGAWRWSDLLTGTPPPTAR